MQIIKVINNNVISSEDDKGKEIIVMGKGIGFGKKAGEEIDETKIEKVFSLPDESTSQFMQVVKDMPYEYIRTAELVIAYARETLGYHLSKNIYVTLTDHLGYAIERKQQGIVVANELSIPPEILQCRISGGIESLRYCKTGTRRGAAGG